MYVRIVYPEGWASFDDICVWKVGLKPRAERMFLYQVIDKQLFFLSVIRYGIVFDEVHDFAIGAPNREKKI